MKTKFQAAKVEESRLLDQRLFYVKNSGPSLQTYVSNEELEVLELLAIEICTKAETRYRNMSFLTNQTPNYRAKIIEKLCIGLEKLPSAHTVMLEAIGVVLTASNNARLIAKSHHPGSDAVQ